MSKEHTPQSAEPKNIGPDLFIPILGFVFTLYYFYTIWDLTFEAQVNGLVMGSALLLLVGIFFIRSFLKVARGEARLALGHILGEPGVARQRLGLALISIVFILVIPWLGFTLSVFGFLLSALTLLGTRNKTILFGISIGLSLSGYLLFIFLLKARFPAGPFEKLMERLF